MTYRQTAARVAIIRAQSEKLGAVLPGEFAEGVARLADLYAPPAEHSPAALAAAIVAAGAASRDPFTDENVMLELTRREHGAMVAGVLDEARAAALEQLITEQAPAILSAWAPLVAELGDTIAAAVEAMPGAKFTKANESYTAGTNPDKLRQWGEAYAAVHTLDAIGSTTGQLLSAGPNRALIGAPMTGEQLNDVTADGHRGDLYGPALIGLPLDLATTRDEYQQRVDAITHGAMLAEQAYADAKRRPSLLPA
ncbi:hypothetical protein [Tessaracoccus sp. Z1128]